MPHTPTPTGYVTTIINGVNIADLGYDNSLGKPSDAQIDVIAGYLKSSNDISSEGFQKYLWEPDEVLTNGGMQVTWLANVKPKNSSSAPAPTISWGEVPIREYMEAYGANVFWYPQMGLVNVIYYGRSEKFYVSDYKIVDGKMYVDKDILNKKFGLTDMKYDIKDFNCKAYAYGVTDRELNFQQGSNDVRLKGVGSMDVSLPDGSYLIATRDYYNPRNPPGSAPATNHYMKQDPVTGVWWEKSAESPIQNLGWINPDDDRNWTDQNDYIQSETRYYIVTGTSFWSK